MIPLSQQTKKRIAEALKEDIGFGDMTSELLVGSRPRGKAFILARERGVFFGESLTREILHAVDPAMKVRFFCREGRVFPKGRPLMEISGRILSLLKAERTLLNFLGHLCGVASLTRAWAEAAKKEHVLIYDTRKTTPLWRELEKAAVRAGGGRNHRMRLDHELFIKENHRGFGTLKRLHLFPRGFVMEVRNQKELKEALPLRPRVLLFDNFSPARLKQAVQWVRKRDPKILLEASGGIHGGNLRRYASTGIDRISMGSLTHSVKAIDLSLLIHPVHA